MIEEFERHLRGTNLSENTISSYLFALRQYSSQYDGITKKNLRAYKVWLIENYKPKTVNLRLRAINCYLESIGKESWKMPFVRVQQKAFLENVISEADYEYFKTCLKRDDELFWYFVIRFLAATGARVSELIQIKVEHIKLGHLDLYSKGGKLRRIYIPKALQNEALSWLNDKHQESGFIFLNKYGDRITTRGISGQLKKLAVRYGIDPAVVYPHSFRHRFAKSFLERCNDIAFLADYSSFSKNVDFAGRMVYDDNGTEVFNFGKYKGMSVAEVLKKDPGYYSWILNSDFTLNTKAALTKIRLREMSNLITK